MWPNHRWDWSVHGTVPWQLSFWKMAATMAVVSLLTFVMPPQIWRNWQYGGWPGQRLEVLEMNLCKQNSLASSPRVWLGLGETFLAKKYLVLGMDGGSFLCAAVQLWLCPCGLCPGEKLGCALGSGLFRGAAYQSAAAARLLALSAGISQCWQEAGISQYPKEEEKEQDIGSCFEIFEFDISSGHCLNMFWKKGRNVPWLGNGRSAKRWLDRSRSNSHTATGQYIRATGCSSTVRCSKAYQLLPYFDTFLESFAFLFGSPSFKLDLCRFQSKNPAPMQFALGWWERRRDSDDSDSGGRTKRAQKAEADLIAKRPRQVSIKGVWAQFMYSGLSYYFNIRTEQTVWETPEEFEEEKSKQTNAIIWAKKVDLHGWAHPCLEQRCISTDLSRSCFQWPRSYRSCATCPISRAQSAITNPHFFDINNFSGKRKFWIYISKYIIACSCQFLSKHHGLEIISSFTIAPGFTRVPCVISDTFWSWEVW